MAPRYGPKIVKDGLVLALDAANVKSSLKAVEVLVVAGGGGGNARHAGGGGGGGLIYNPNFSIIPGSAITVTVGAGGIGGTETANWSTSPVTTNGGNSVFGSLTSLGGGGGGYNVAGMIGGSGGGGGDTNAGIILGGAGTVGQGFAGGNSANGAYFGGGGGGGAGAAGSDGINGAGGAGGSGLNFSISGSPTWYAGGGGGAAGYNKGSLGGTGGIGGGGRGDNSGSAGAIVQNGTPNTGGGGGAHSTPYPSAGSGKAGDGGSGIVIVRYKGSQRATGGVVTFINGYTIHTFTTSGTFTPNGAPGTGTIWTDVSKNGKSGTIMNGVGYNSANGGSLVFDGINDYAQVTSATMDLSAGISMEMLFKSTDMNSRAQGFMRYNVGSYFINFYTSGSKIRWETFAPSPTAGGAFYSPTTLLNNTWYHVVGTYSNGSSILYINGNNVASASQTAGNYGSSYTANVVLGEYAGYMAGNIAVSKIYNRALTALEVKQNFNALRGRYGL